MAGKCPVSVYYPSKAAKGPFEPRKRAHSPQVAAESFNLVTRPGRVTSDQLLLPYQMQNTLER
jgi:hypothetical protein